MSYTEDQKRDLLKTVEALMNKANIPVRDTWNGFDGENMDDAIQNNGQSGGPKLFDVVIDGQDKAQVSGHAIYEINGYKSVAYDNYKVRLPTRHANKKHPAIHETVHFLQHMTSGEDSKYIPLNSQNVNDYKEYVSQRCEQEAHFVQLLYIDEFEWTIENKELKKEFTSRLNEALIDESKRAELIVYAKSNGIV